MEIILILFLAIAIDLALGEPPRAIHPVVWMGKVTSFLEKHNLARRPTAQFLFGLVMVVVTVGLFVAPVYCRKSHSGYHLFLDCQEPAPGNATIRILFSAIPAPLRVYVPF